MRRIRHPRRPLPTGTGPAARLARRVFELSVRIGERNPDHPGALKAAEAYVESEMRKAGYRPLSQEYRLGGPHDARIRPRNIAAILPGTGPGAPVFVVGAHYDTAPGTPGADDNATGVAALLELAARLKSRPGKAEVRFVAFSTEEPPYFGSSHMGSAHYARALKNEGRAVIGMISLEMLGFYSDADGSQSYPPIIGLFYPDRGDFIGLVSDLGSRHFLKTFAAQCRPPRGTRVVSSALPKIIPAITFSDHWPFWRQGFQALMVTDTAFLRYIHYHRPTDLPENLDFERMADVVDGLERAVTALTR